MYFTCTVWKAIGNGEFDRFQTFGGRGRCCNLTHTSRFRKLLLMLLLSQRDTDDVKFVKHISADGAIYFGFFDIQYWLPEELEGASWLQTIDHWCFSVLFFNLSVHFLVMYWPEEQLGKMRGVEPAMFSSPHFFTLRHGWGETCQMIISANKSQKRYVPMRCAPFNSFSSWVDRLLYVLSPGITVTS